MIVNRQWFKKQGACTNAFLWGHSQYKKEKSIDLKELINRLISQHSEIRKQYDTNSYLWIEWIFYKIFTKEQERKYIICIAEQLLSLFEEKCSNIKRPRRAIKAIKKYLENPTEENARTAHVAYTAVHTLIYTTRNINTTYIAAYTIYSIIGNILDNTYYSKRAVSITYTTSGIITTEIQKKIIEYGLSLLEDKSYNEKY